jgi:hypothetical protein
MLRDSKVDAKGHIKNKQDSKKQTKNKSETK